MMVSYKQTCASVANAFLGMTSDYVFAHHI